MPCLGCSMSVMGKRHSAAAGWKVRDVRDEGRVDTTHKNGDEWGMVNLIVILSNLNVFLEAFLA